MHPVVIIGSGLAGYNVARELRKLDRETPLTVVTADGGQFYSKPPANGAVGEWLIERGADSVKSLFIDSAGKLLGFALNGAATAERAKLARELPPVLA